MSAVMGQMVQVRQLERVSGGDICDSFKAQTNIGPLFVKRCSAQDGGLLQAEFRNLQLLRAAAEICVPEAISVSFHENDTLLVMEYLDLAGNTHDGQLGRRLAALHRHTGPGYGLEYDNYIGRTFQRNTAEETWSAFWWNNRLLPQLQMVCDQGFSNAIEKYILPLNEVCQRLLHNHQPVPSLLHGDLWSGNKGYLEDATPVIFDPACYFGDRETDVALTELFSGFDAEFYREYQQAWPLDEGYPHRKLLYNLYHLLNHLNLFGEFYLASCLQQIQYLQPLK
ncbi:fructosamine-3-kinase [Gynuella sunshinyii YC6258]|uniref:Fructosamine-3-kinase n=2 Tax=Gynuella sunshinyii TaxID=1445505 RepID=A0A0C5VHU2_9GAMM|nr:fructosamine-3-kinase [Gynuella sunshinyii YC6258]